jgi:hypothetical protein
VSSEGLQRVCINLSQHTVPSLNKYSKVGRCADVSNRGGVGVSFFGKRLGEPINVRAAQARAQTPKCLGSGKVLFEHYSSP